MAHARKTASFRSKIGVLKHLPGMRYLEIPKKIVDHLGGKPKGRFICTVNKTVKFQCGLMALGQGRCYVSITQKRLKELGLTEGQTAQVKLEADPSPYGMPMPEELAELLKQDAEGCRRFKALPISMQRYTLFYVNQVKNTDKRLDRAFTLIENLKAQPEGVRVSFAAMLGVKKRSV